MRALHVYSGNLFGGIETLLVTIARHRSLCPDVVHDAALCFDGRLRRELEAAAMRVHRLPSPRVSRPHSVAAARRAMAGLLRRETFDVVICHAAWSQALFGGVARRAGVPLVFWAHDAVTGRHWTERLARRITPDLVLANSDYTARTTTTIYPDVRSRIVLYPVVMPSATISAADRAAVRESLGAPADALVVVQASRMEAWKGHATLLEALARLHGREWVCWQAGGAQRPREASYLESLRALARRLRIADRVRFVGERADVPRLLAAADVYCQPNALPEPFGIVFIEALAAGLPVIASATGGVQEIVDASCGRLVPPGDIPALAAALQLLMDDEPLRRRLARTGPARARQLCDPAAQLQRLCEALAAIEKADVPLSASALQNHV